MAYQYESGKSEKLPEQNGLEGLQMVQFECPRHSNPSVSFSSGVGFPLSGALKQTAFRFAERRLIRQSNYSMMHYGSYDI